MIARDHFLDTVRGRDHTLHATAGTANLDHLAAQATHEITVLDSLGDGDLVTVGGIIGAFARKYTKRGEPYAQFRLEGLAGGVEVVAFPSVYDAVPDLMAADRIVLVTGRIDLRGRELQIRAVEVKEPDLGPDAPRAVAESLVVDLNFLYHPSCRYSDSWVCPLAPAGNTITAPVRAGERL